MISEMFLVMTQPQNQHFVQTMNISSLLSHILYFTKQVDIDGSSTAVISVNFILKNRLKILVKTVKSSYGHVAA